MTRSLAVLRRCLVECVRLFVDDATYTALIVGWIVLACIVLRAVGAGMWSGLMLFAGLAVIFVMTTNGRADISKS